MRKRKSPIVLVTALVVIVAGVAGLQYAWSNTGGVGNASEQPQVAETKAVGDSRPATSPTAVSQGIKGALASSDAKTPTPTPGGPPGAGGSMILNPSASSKPEKPKPNPSSTSTQWYDKDTAAANGNQ